MNYLRTWRTGLWAFRAARVRRPGAHSPAKGGPHEASSVVTCVAMLGALVVVALAFTSCSDDGRPKVRIAAASDVRLAFEEMEPKFEEACQCNVVFSFGSSGTLAAQIEEGLPVDAFFSANEAYVDTLNERGLIAPGTTRLYAIGRIVLATPAGLPKLERLDQLEGEEIRRIALANPDHAPYGLAAKEALRATGVWEQVESKIVLGENASQATTFVQSGNAEAGIIPLSLAMQNSDDITFTIIDDRLHGPLRQSVAVLKDTAEAERAGMFVDFVLGPGAETMRAYGFDLSGEAVNGGD